MNPLCPSNNFNISHKDKKSSLTPIFTKPTISTGNSSPAEPQTKATKSPVNSFNFKFTPLKQDQSENSDSKPLKKDPEGNSMESKPFQLPEADKDVSIAATKDDSAFSINPKRKASMLTENTADQGGHHSFKKKTGESTFEITNNADTTSQTCSNEKDKECNSTKRPCLALNSKNTCEFYTKTFLSRIGTAEAKRAAIEGRMEEWKCDISGQVIPLGLFKTDPRVKQVTFCTSGDGSHTLLVVVMDKIKSKEVHTTSMVPSESKIEDKIEPQTGLKESPVALELKKTNAATVPLLPKPIFTSPNSAATSEPPKPKFSFSPAVSAPAKEDTSKPKPLFGSNNEPTLQTSKPESKPLGFTFLSQTNNTSLKSDELAASKADPTLPSKSAFSLDMTAQKSITLGKNDEKVASESKPAPVFSFGAAAPATTQSQPLPIFGLPASQSKAENPFGSKPFSVTSSQPQSSVNEKSTTLKEASSTLATSLPFGVTSSVTTTSNVDSLKPFSFVQPTVTSTVPPSTGFNFTPAESKSSTATGFTGFSTSSFGANASVPTFSFGQAKPPSEQASAFQLEKKDTSTSSSLGFSQQQSMVPPSPLKFSFGTSNSGQGSGATPGTSQPISFGFAQPPTSSSIQTSGFKFQFNASSQPSQPQPQGQNDMVMSDIMDISSSVNPPETAVATPNMTNPISATSFNFGATQSPFNSGQAPIFQFGSSSTGFGSSQNPSTAATGAATGGSVAQPRKIAQPRRRRR